MNQEIDLGEINKIDLEDIKAVFVDIDDTLYSYAESHSVAIEYCYKIFKEYFSGDLGININNFEQFEVRYRKARDDVTKRLFPGGSCRSRLLAFKDIFEEISCISNISAYKYAIEFEELYWSSLIQSIKPNKEMKSFLEFCQSRIPELIICAVSDMQTTYQIRKLIKLGYGDFALVTSEEVGVEKPNPLIFQYALEKLHLNPNEVIMIGDSYEKDVDGASKLGIRSFLININD